MKKIILAIAFLMVAESLFSQTDDLHGFAIIKDKDGFTNIRKEPNAKSKIIGTIKDDELFYCLWNEGHEDWYEISFRHESGFIHKSRIKSLNKLAYIGNKKAIKDTLFFKNDSINAKIVINAFILKQHKIEKKDNFVFRIDEKEPRGVDGGLPNTGIQSIQIKIGDDIVDIPQTELSDLFQPNFETSNIYIRPKETIFLVMSNSDGAGSYDVAFVIKNKKFVKRYVFYGF